MNSDALFNEVARILNKEFFQQGQPISGRLLQQLIIAVNQVLTDEPDSA